MVANYSVFVRRLQYVLPASTTLMQGDFISVERLSGTLYGPISCQQVFSHLQGVSDDFRNLADIDVVGEGTIKLPYHSAFLRLHSRVFDKLLAREANSDQACVTNEGFHDFHVSWIV